MGERGPRHITRDTTAHHRVTLYHNKRGSGEFFFCGSFCVWYLIYQSETEGMGARGSGVRALCVKAVRESYA